MSAIATIDRGSVRNAAPRCAETVKSATARKAGIVLLQFLLLAAIVAAWQLLSGHLLPVYLFSRPTAVALALYRFLASAVGWHDVGRTMEEVVVGYAIGLASGLFLGAALAASELASRVLEPLIAAISGIPHITLAPIFVLLLGLGINSKIGLAAFNVLFIMFYCTYTGFRTGDRGLTDTVRLFGASRSLTFRTVTLRGMLPSLFAGLRVSYFAAMAGAIVGEFVSANSGIGYYIVTSTNVDNTAGTFAGLTLLLILALITNAIFQMASHQLFRWTRVAP